MNIKKKIKYTSIFFVVSLILITIFFLIKNSRKINETGAGLPEGVTSEAKKIVYSEIKGSRVIFKLEAEKNLIKEGKEFYKKVRGLYYERKSKEPDIITSELCEKVNNSGEIKFLNNVKVKLRNGLIIEGEEFHYKKESGLIFCPEECRFYSEKIGGEGRECEIEERKKTLFFKKPFSLIGKEKGVKFKVKGGEGLFDSKKKIMKVNKDGKILGEKYKLISDKLKLIFNSREEIEKSLSPSGGKIFLGKDNLMSGGSIDILFNNWKPQKIILKNKSEIILKNGIYIKGENCEIELKNDEINRFKCEKDVKGKFSDGNNDRKFKADEGVFLFETGQIYGIDLVGNASLHLKAGSFLSGNRLEISFKNNHLGNINIFKGQLFEKNYSVKGKNLELLFQNGKIKEIKGINILIKMVKENKKLYGNKGSIEFDRGNFKRIFLNGNVSVKTEKGGILKSNKLKVVQALGKIKKYNFYFSGNFSGVKDGMEIHAEESKFFYSGKTVYKKVKLYGKRYTIKSEKCILYSSGVYKFYGNVIFNLKDKGEIITSNKLIKKKDFLTFEGSVRLLGDNFTLKSDILDVFTENKRLRGKGDIYFLADLKSGEKLLIKSDRFLENGEEKVFQGKCNMKIGGIKVKAEKIMYKTGKKENLLIGEQNVVVDALKFNAFGDKLFYYVKMDKIVIQGKRVKVINKEENSISSGKKLVYFKKKESFEIE